MLTAAGGGIGRSVARIFGRSGSHVVVSDRDSAAARAVADEIVAGGGRATGVGCDVSVDEDVASLANVVNQIGPVDVLFNNAGVAAAGPIGKIPLDDWRWIFEVNVLGQVRAINAFLPGMADRRSGLIINTSSSLALFPEAPLLLPYICSKAGILGFTEALSLMCTPLGIRVMVLAPHITETNFLFSARLSGIEPEQAMQILPLSEVQPPEAVADALFRAIAAGEFLATNAPDADSLLLDRAADRFEPKVRSCASLADPIAGLAGLLAGARNPGRAVGTSDRLSD
ncbi:SDR family NAD(P)-dependent oxidoreductase [Mycobacterium sp. NPDC049093]